VTESSPLRSLLGRLYLDIWSHWRRLSSVFRRRATPTQAEPVAPSQRPRILVVSPFSIHPVIHGGAVRISNLIRRMARTCDVSLLVLGGGTDDPGHRRAYAGLCEHVFIHRVPDRGDAIPDPWGLLPPAPRRLSHPSVADRISALVDAHDFDIVQLEFAELGTHVRRLDGARTILTEHDIAFKTQRRQRALNIGRRFDAVDSVGSGPADGRRQEHFEIGACEAADQVHCMSDDDRDFLALRLSRSDHLRVIPNGVDTEVYRRGPAADRRGVLFLGSFPHLPNLDAFEYLIDEVWPAIRERQPDSFVTVAGARPPDRVLARDGRDGLHVVGEVDEAAPLYREHRVLVVPLRAGSGTRLKIIEALASGLPVVSTTIGAEGLVLSDPPEITIADDPKTMADEVAALLTADDETIAAIGGRGRAMARACFDWTAIADDLFRAYAELMALGPTTRPLRVRTLDPPVGDQQPAITVVIPTSQRFGLTDALIDGLARQQTGTHVEIICVDLDSPQERLDQWRESGIRVLSVDRPLPNQGATLNAGAIAARGRILVFTSATAIPADEHWLARLVAPFDHDDAPAAVQGGITAQLIDGAPAHLTGFTKESEGWRQTFGGIEFSAVNAAMPRSVWERFPFSPRTLLADRAWQRIAADHNLLILPCLAAAVRDLGQDTARNLLWASIREGRAWRDLGARYTFSDCWTDVIHGRPLIGEDVKPTQKVACGLMTYRLFRPVGLYLGNRFPAPRSRPGRYTPS
jgi:glycosyltransferase involved in cell wall biosynthesis